MGYIKYFDAHFTNFTGGVETIENCVCLHEEDHGILWKHQDWRTGVAEVRRSRRLTVSFICTVANYEYGFYWHFYQASIMLFFNCALPVLYLHYRIVEMEIGTNLNNMMFHLSSLEFSQQYSYGSMFSIPGWED